MNIPHSAEEQKKNALLIKVKMQLPKPSKTKIKKMGAIWLEAYQSYAISLSQKDSIQAFLDPWKAHIAFSEMYLDPVLFSPAGKIQNNHELRLSMLHTEIYQESMQLMCDIHAYDQTLSENDFDDIPSQEGKTT